MEMGVRRDACLERFEVDAVDEVRTAAPKVDVVIAEPRRAPPKESRGTKRLGRRCAPAIMARMTTAHREPSACEHDPAREEGGQLDA